MLSIVYCLSQVQRFFPFIIVQLENSCKKLSSSVSQLLLCSESKTKTYYDDKILCGGEKQTSEMMRKCCNKALIDTEYISSCLATQLCLVQSSQFWCLH